MVSRYGKTPRERWKKARAASSKRYRCPQCSRVAVKRVAAGVWQCKKCGTKYASDAYEFKVK